MKKILFLSLILVIALVLSGCDVTGSGDVELVNIWEKEYSISTDNTGTVVESESENYPLELCSEDEYGTDPDNDGTDESALLSIFYEFTDKTLRTYVKYDVTDGGNDTTTLAEKYNLVEIFTLSNEETYALNGNTITYTADGEAFSDTTIFSISGTTLTLTNVDDDETPADTSDDVTEVSVYTLASSSDIADAVDEGDGDS